MQTIKATLLLLMSTTLLSACGLKGPLYLPDEDATARPGLEQDNPLEMDSTDNTQVKKKKSNPG